MGRRLLVSLFATLVLLVLTVGSSAAAPVPPGLTTPPPATISPEAIPPGLPQSHSQPPLYAVYKVATEDTVAPGQMLQYLVVFMLTDPAKNVVIQDAFMNGVYLASPGTLFNYTTGSPSSSTTINPTLVAYYPGRETVNFSLGDLDAGIYVLAFYGQVDPFKKAGAGQSVKNSSTVYIGGKWKGTWEAMTPVVAP